MLSMGMAKVDVATTTKGALSFLLAVVLACSATPAHDAQPVAAATAKPATSGAAAQTPSPTPAPKRTARAAILEPTALAALQREGFALAELVVGSEARTTEELSKTAGFGSILGQVRTDLRRTKHETPSAQVTSMMGVRLFDERWLASPEMSFDLIGVLNRLDRRAFYGGTCGEIRFLYRLGYKTTAGGEPMRERLPLVVNVVYLVEGDCREVARAWLFPELKGQALAEWARRSGPISASQRANWQLKAVETNIQTVRWQSTAFASMAGHAEYVLRVLHPKDESLSAFIPAPLENTPDTERLTAKQKAALRAYLREPAQLAKIDRGTLTIPERFLARKARSSTARGLTRVSNRPFSELFAKEDFADLDLSRFITIKSPAALIRRLDAATCMGCHQSRAIAGFHLVGAESEPKRKYEALFSGVSPHLHGDLARRRAYTAAVAAGDEPDELRPLPETQGGAPGIENAPLGSATRAFPT